MTLLPLSTPVAFFPPRRLLVLPFLLFASSSFTDLPMTGAPCTQAQHSGVSKESRQAHSKKRRHNDKCSRGGHLADHRLLPFPRLLLTCIISSSVFGFLSLTNLGRGFAAAEPLFGFGFGFSSATASPSAPSSTSTSS